MPEELPPLPLPYKYRLPRGRIRRPPLLFLLHGLGTDELTFLNMVSNFDDRFLIISPRALLSESPGAPVWFKMERIGGTSFINSVQAEHSRKQVSNFIREAVRILKADPEQIYLLGFSQGAVITLSLLLTEPELLAGAVAITGQILPDIRAHMASAGRFKGKPVLLMHGLQDPIYPIPLGRAASVLMASLPLSLEYHIIADMQHILTAECLEKARLWLSKQLDKQGIFSLSDQTDYALRISGVQLKVRDLDRSIAFYVRVLGMELRERTGKTYAFLTNNDSHHVIALQNVGMGGTLPKPETPGLYSVQFEVPDQITFARLYQRLTESGITVSLTDHLISWGMYFQDPDGNGIEIYWDTRDLPGHSHLWQGRDLPISPEKILALLS